LFARPLLLQIDGWRGVRNEKRTDGDRQAGERQQDGEDGEWEQSEDGNQMPIKTPT
jgi:hypothetical protein